MFQEIPRDNYPSSKRKCDRQNFDTSQSAELEGNIPGIHSVFFLEDMARAWREQVNQIQAYLGITSLSATKPLQLGFDFHINKSAWQDMVEKCKSINKTR